MNILTPSPIYIEADSAALPAAGYCANCQCESCQRERLRLFRINNRHRLLVRWERDRAYVEWYQPKPTNRVRKRERDSVLAHSCSKRYFGLYSTVYRPKWQAEIRAHDQWGARTLCAVGFDDLMVST